MLYDLHKAGRDFTPGVYVTDRKTLWRILDLAERRQGLLPLEDCRFPEAPPVWRSVQWLTEHKAKVIRP
jgi:hypothetical protein